MRFRNWKRYLLCLLYAASIFLVVNYGRYQAVQMAQIIANSNPPYSDFCQPYMSPRLENMDHIEEDAHHFYPFDHPLLTPGFKNGAAKSNDSASSFCEANILAFVLSAVSNNRRRNLIRETWGSSKYFKETGIRVIFILGGTFDAKQQATVEEESTTFGDILQIAVFDEYRKLLCKVVSALHFANKKCPNLNWFAKIDDDVIVNPFAFSSFIAKEDAKVLKRNAVYGQFRAGLKPHREGKWSLTRKEYRKRLLPPFTLGPTYFMRFKTAQTLLQTLPSVNTVYLEDVFLTGLVAKKAKVGHVNVSAKMFYRGTRYKNFTSHNSSFWVHNMSELRRTSYMKRLFKDRYKGTNDKPSIEKETLKTA